MEHIQEKPSEQTLARWEKAREKKRLFIKGPICLGWVKRALQLRSSAISVALALWFQRGCQRANQPIRLTPTLLKTVGIKPRTAYRGLEALEKAGLVVIDRHRGRCPRVTIVEVEKSD